MNEAAITKPQTAVTRFGSEQVELIKRTICKGATDDELKLFLWQAERTGLDPFTRQIYSVERREYRDGKWITSRQTMTSIDGFRLIAERTGKYAGQKGPLWCDADGEWIDVWLGKGSPVAAKVGVLRSDFSEPCWGVARFESYAQKTKDGVPTKAWTKMGDVMVAKCAEALALRKAFPQELSGLYTNEEMEQATIAEPQRPIAKPNVMIPHDAETGEIEESTESSATGAADDRTAAEWDVELGEAAKEGTVALQDVWSFIPAEHKSTLKAALNRRHKITAANVDAERAPT